MKKLLGKMALGAAEEVGKQMTAKGVGSNEEIVWTAFTKRGSMVIIQGKKVIKIIKKGNY